MSSRVCVRHQREMRSRRITEPGVFGCSCSQIFVEQGSFSSVVQGNGDRLELVCLLFGSQVRRSYCWACYYLWLWEGPFGWPIIQLLRLSSSGDRLYWTIFDVFAYLLSYVFTFPHQQADDCASHWPGCYSWDSTVVAAQWGAGGQIVVFHIRTTRKSTVWLD